MFNPVLIVVISLGVWNFISEIATKECIEKNEQFWEMASSSQYLIFFGVVQAIYLLITLIVCVQKKCTSFGHNCLMKHRRRQARRGAGADASQEEIANAQVQIADYKSSDEIEDERFEVEFRESEVRRQRRLRENEAAAQE